MLWYDKYTMTGTIPYWIEGEVKYVHSNEALVKVPNGSVYQLTPDTPGIVFSELRIGDKVACEVTHRILYVYSARII
jgi:hypothetical protein